MDIEKCDKCKGKGFQRFILGPNIPCIKCYGTGEVTWVEKVFGVDPNTSAQKIAERTARKLSDLSQSERIYHIRDVEYELNQSYRKIGIGVDCYLERLVGDEYYVRVNFYEMENYDNKT